MKNKKSPPIGGRGFTLFELLVVISIIGILVAVGMASFSSAQKRGRDARRRQDLKTVQNALEQYYADSEAEYIVNCDPGADYLLGGLPEDPKNVDPYIYNYDCPDTEIYCICANLEVEGSGNASDIGSSGVCSYGSGDFFCVSNLQ